MGVNEVCPGHCDPIGCRGAESVVAGSLMASVSTQKGTGDVVPVCARERVYYSDYSTRALDCLVLCAISS